MKKITYIIVLLITILNINVVVNATTQSNFKSEVFENKENLLLYEEEVIDDTIYENYEDEETELVSCGKKLITNIPKSIPRIVHIIYLVIQIAVPIILVILGMLDLFKGITAQKDDETKKGQQLFIKRLIGAALIFFIFLIVKLFIGFVADSSSNRIIGCAECFINNDCS